MNRYTYQIAKQTLRTLAELERRGCQVVSAAVLPSPAVHISPPPPGAISTFGYRAPPPGAWRCPVECVAMVRGTRVTWWARP